MKYFVLAVIFIFAVLAVQNSWDIKISFLWWNVSIPIILVVLGSTLVGFLFGLFVRFSKKEKKPVPQTQETDKET